MKKNLIIISLISLLGAEELSQYKVSINDTLSGMIKDFPMTQIKSQEINQTVMTPIDMSIGDINRGRYIYSKYMKRYCNMTQIQFAGLYTQDEWEDIVEAGKFKEFIIRSCPKITKIYQDKWSPHLYEFVYRYAKDSEFNN